MTRGRLCFAGLALVTACAAFCLPTETAGKKLDAEQDDNDDDGGGVGRREGGGGDSSSQGIGSTEMRESHAKVGDVELSAAARGVAMSSR